MISLTETARYRMSIILAIILWILVLGGLVLAGIAGYVKFSLTEYTQIVENYDGSTLPIFLVSTGGFVILSHAMGGVFLLTMSDPKRREDFGKIFLGLVITLALVAVLILTSAILCFTHTQHLHDSFQGGITKAMEIYGVEPHVKEEIDHLQMNFQCCGNDMYEDWLKIRWNNLYNASDTVPFSCCDPKSTRPCVMEAIHTNSKHYNYNYQTDLTLHKTGCREALMDYFGDDILVPSASIVLGMFGLEIIVVIVARILQTSMASAVELGDPETEAPGYIVKCSSNSDDHDEFSALPTTNSRSGRGSTGSRSVRSKASRVSQSRRSRNSLPISVKGKTSISSGYLNIRDSQVASSTRGFVPIPSPPLPPPEYQ